MQLLLRITLISLPYDEPATRLGEIGLSTVLKTYGDIEWIGKILIIKNI